MRLKQTGLSGGARALRWMRRRLPWLGGGLLAIAAVLAGQRWWLAQGMERATATVTEEVAAFGREGGVVYAPRFVFRDEAGRLVTVLSSRSDGYEVFAEGRQVPVLYPRGVPQRAVIAVWWRWYGWAVAFGVAGVVLFDAGWVLRRMGRETGQGEGSGQGAEVL